MRKEFLLFWFCFICFLVKAQEPVIAHSPDFQEFSIEQISLDQGLSQGMIFSMIQDHHGYIWAATKDGLNRYDGMGFKVFRHNPDDSLSISNNTIHSIIQDHKQRIWVGTATAGINLYDAATESFIRFLNEPGKPQLLPSNTIGEVQKDGNGNVVFQILGNGYVVIKEKPGKHKTIKDAFEILAIGDVYPQLTETEQNGYSVHNLCFSPGGDAWYFKNDTIYGFTVDMLQSGEKPFKFPYSIKESFDGVNRVPYIFDRIRNHTYIITQQNVLNRFDATSKTFVPVLQLPAGYKFISSVLIDELGRVWSWLPEGNIIRVNLKDGKMMVIRPVWNVKINHTEYTYKFAFEGMHDNIWLSTAGYGMFKISARNELFKKVPSDAPKFHQHLWSHRIEQPGVKAGYDINLNNKWIGICNKLQSKYEDIDFLWGLAYDQKGYFWAITVFESTLEQSVVRINAHTANPDLEFFKSIPDTKEQLGLFFFDKSGDLWIGAPKEKEAPALIHLLNNQNPEEDFTLTIDPGESEYGFISDYHVDADGLFWLGTIKGLFSFDPITKKTQQFVNIPGDAGSLSKDFILSVCPDPAEPERYLWVGTEGGGLNRFDITSKIFTRFSTEIGLPNNVIYGIQSDSRNNLWISTNNGICQFNPQTLAVRNFTKADGLVSNEFNRYQFSKAADGTLYFGSPDGVNYFQPEDFYAEAAPSKVIINKLELLNKEVVYQHLQILKKDNEFRLPTPIEHCKELIFNYDHRMITLGFALLDFTTPNQNRFKYMLEGFDKDWLEVGSKSEATYTNLNPGTYTFKVMGCNSSNIWSKPAQINILVLAPWWGTWWFRSLMAMVFAGFLYSLYRYRLLKALELERVRNRIAQDLHDEIGSTLSSISLYSAAIQKNPIGISKQNQNILNKISQSTTKMMEGMNDMVWTIKADNDKFEHVVYRMRAFAVNMTEAKDIQLHFTADEDTQSLSLNMDQRKNIYLIFKEAVNNAVKYSGCKNLFVTISNFTGKLEMIIEDDGDGFELGAVAQNYNIMGGNGLRSMKMRAIDIAGILEIDTQENRGTRVVFKMAVRW